jgi:hypothetical protein
MAEAVDPAVLNPLPPPTPEESANNPTRTIHYEYTQFCKRYRSENLSEASLRSGGPYYTSMDATQPNFVCSRESFYLSLLHFSVDQQGSIDIFRKCATQGVVGVAGAPQDPVDAAIRAYSILINNLYLKGDIDYIGRVVSFLQIDYAYVISEDPGVKTRYLESKQIVFELLGNDYYAFIASPPLMRMNIIRYFVHVFNKDNFYIDSSPIAKKAIAKFVITYPVEDMVRVYQEGMSDLVKVHFFAFILNNIRRFYIQPCRFTCSSNWTRYKKLFDTSIKQS